MSKKVFKIALTGAYEIANYGDHLFPLVFKEKMKEKNIDVDLYLFSVYEGIQAFNTKEKVYSLSQMEKMHKEINFDAVVVGGGELIHFSSCMQLLNPNDTEYKKYRIFETWVIPSLLGLKYNVPILWNAPGGQYSFPDIYNDLIKLLCRPISYMSVRNYTTKKNLELCGIDSNRIKYVPDTGLSISTIYSKEYLRPIFKSLISSNKPYIVYHCNRHISEESINEIIIYLDALYKQGYEIVLLPLAYTHNDHGILKKINEKANNKYITFDKMLSLEETISILAFTSLYIGISFHGAVTSIAYDNRAIIYDYIGSEKSIDLFKLFNCSDYYISDINKLDNAIKMIMQNKPKYILSDALAEIEQHFNTIVSTLESFESENTNTNDDFSYFSSFIETSIKNYFDNSFTIENDKQIISNAKTHISNINAELNHAKKNITSLENELDRAREYMRHLESELENARNYITELQKENSTLHIANSELENQINKRRFWKRKSWSSILICLLWFIGGIFYMLFFICTSQHSTVDMHRSWLSPSIPDL